MPHLRISVRCSHMGKQTPSTGQAALALSSHKARRRLLGLLLGPTTGNSIAMGRCEQAWALPGSTAVALSARHISPALCWHALALHAFALALAVVLQPMVRLAGAAGLAQQLIGLRPQRGSGPLQRRICCTAWCAKGCCTRYRLGC